MLRKSRNAMPRKELLLVIYILAAYNNIKSAVKDAQKGNVLMQTSLNKVYNLLNNISDL